MKWATRECVHVDRAASAWLLRRFVDEDARFVFFAEDAEAPQDATPFDVPGVELSHHGADCTFETILRVYGLSGDAALSDIGRIVHEADLADERYDAPEAAGLDVLIRGMSMVLADGDVIATAALLFDGLYEYRRRANELGTIPS